MHTRRIATFLLGAWMAGSVVLALIEIQNYRSPGLVLEHPLPPVTKMLQTLSQEQARLLLRHLAAEQTRYYSRFWERLEIALGLGLGICLLRATQTRALPVGLCALMLTLAAFQYFAVTPELAYQGRETDFPPGNAALGPMARVWALQQVYAAVEIVKLIAGGVLAGYLFVFQTPRKSRKEAESLAPSPQGPLFR